MVEQAEIGPLIRELRYRLGLTPDKLAAKLAVSVQAVARWEQNGAVARPSLFTQRQLAQVLRELGAAGDDLRATYCGDEAEH